MIHVFLMNESNFNHILRAAVYVTLLFMAALVVLMYGSLICL